MQHIHVPHLQSRQSGLTMVELLVAMAISTVIAIAAISALIVSRRGFTAVDASSQLRDNARFAIDLLQRLGVQTGYEDVQYAATVRPVNNVKVAANPAPNIFGFNNAAVSSSDPLNSSVARPTGSVDGSDVLILRYQAGETFPGSATSDKTMIDCAGYPAASIPADLDDRMVSILDVGTGVDGEPSLRCTYLGSSGTYTTQPIVQGVENFQVLYGVDKVTANTAPTAATNSVADSYLRADQMAVAGNSVATNANWRRVRSLRIGMVLRGPLGSAQDKTAQTFYPFGQAKSSSSGAIGSAMSSSSDTGTVFSPGADGRLRQTVTFTVYLRNEQGL
ncbi:PilW family protein [Rhodoferax sp.]|uniref:PilW family protein n=1 Tax=Rhodoferax sp. TaxID=50421 RepID=UPI00374DECC5